MRVDERADIYALGAILYHVLAGRPPYGSADPISIIGSLRARRPPRLASRGVDRELLSIAAKALNLDANQRYVTVGAMVEDLRLNQQGRRIRAYRYSAADLLRRWMSRHITAALTITGVVLLIAAIATASALRVIAERRRGDAANVELELANRSLAERLPIGAYLHHADNPIRGWIATGNRRIADEMSVDHSVTWRGRPTARIQSIQDKQPDEYGSLRQTFSAAAFVGKRVRFSSYLKTSGVTGWAGLSMRIDGAVDRREPLAFDNMYKRRVTGSHEWSRYEVVLDVPEGATVIVIGIHLAGGGRVWAGGAEVTPVDRRTPTTAPIGTERLFASAPRNLDLQEGMAAYGAPIGWYPVGPATELYEFGMEPTGSPREKPAAYMRSKSPKIAGFGALAQSAQVAAGTRKRLRFSALLRTVGVSGRAGLWMRIDGDQGTIALDNMADRAVSGTTEFRRYAVVLERGDDALFVNFGVLLQGTGTVVFSDAKLESVSDDVQLTGLPPDAPRNLNFED